MSDNMGTCQFCGQRRFINTVGEIDQEERDRIATDLCECIDAKTAKRKAERSEKIKDYVEDEFPVEVAEFVTKGIELVDDQSIEKVTVKIDDDWNVEIWRDANLYLHIRQKRLDVKEESF